MTITEIIQGASYSWTECLSDYLPSDGWAIVFYFRGAGTGVNLDASIDNDEFVFTLTTTQTAAFSAGTYSWQLFATKDDQKVFIAEGEVRVKSGLGAIDASDTFDGRSQNKITLDAIDAMLANKANLDQQSYVIGNRQLQRIPIPDLLKLRETYQRLVNQEIRAAKAKNGKGKIFTPYYGRFKRPE